MSTLLFTFNSFADIPLSEFKECSEIDNKNQRGLCFDLLAANYGLGPKALEDIPSLPIAKEFPAYVKTIHGSIQKHFKDERANREIFKDLFKLETLNAILNLMKDGRWPVGNSTRDYQVDLPNNPWGCISGTNTTPMKEYQFNQFTDHMIKFWKSAERGTDSDSSQFNKTIDYFGRMGQILAANDLLLCSFNSSLNNNPANRLRKIDAAKFSVIEEYMFSDSYK